jgi:hypothetical protein
MAKKPMLLHLPARDYRIEKTIEIPASAGIHIVGDGQRSRLVWAGQDSGPVMRVNGPVHATLRDFSINGSGSADGLAIVNCDQPEARIFMEQANITSAKSIGFFVDRLVNARVDLHDFEHSNCKLAVKVIGAGADTARTSRVSIFGGASSSNEISYDVADGGWLLARDIWYETNNQPRFLNFTGSGTFTLNGAIVSVPQKDGTPPIVFDNFRGKATLVTTGIIGGENRPAPVLIKGEAKASNVLLLGIQVGIGEGYVRNEAKAGRFALRESFMYVKGGGSAPIADAGLMDDEFVREMLRQARESRPRPLVDVPVTATDLRLYRVMVSNAQTGFRLSR